MKKQMLRLYAIDSYYGKNANFINNNYINISIEKILKKLNTDHGYHLRLKKKGTYILYLDVDNYKGSINELLNIFIHFFKKYYNLELKIEDIKYTQNEGDNTSYHITIPRYHCSILKQHDIWKHLLDLYKDDKKFVYKEGDKICKTIDLSVYCNKWFRLPNQSKEGKENSRHIIKNGELKDFILKYIPENSININDIIKIETNKCVNNKSKRVNITDKYPTKYVTERLSNENDIEELKKLLKEIVDNLDEDMRINYNKWVQLGMLLVKFGDYGIHLWDEFSKKNSKYKIGEIDWKCRTFSLNDGLFFPSLMRWLWEDNRGYYIIINNKYSKLLCKFGIMKKSDILSMLERGHLSIAKHYCDKNKENIKFCNDWYIYDKETGKWDLKTQDNVVTDISLLLEYYINECMQECLLSNDVKSITSLSTLLNKITNCNYIASIMAYCRTFLLDDKFIDKLDVCKETLNFSNGIYNLRTGEFRNRECSDYVSKCLDYEFNPIKNDKLIKKIEEVIYRISNNDTELYEFNLSWLGYCLTGETNLQKFLFIVGHTASNGKSTLARIFSNSLPIYRRKLDKRTFSEGYSKSHKQFATIKKPIRFVYIEELDRNKLDVNLFKDFVDGDKIGGNEVLYGTTEDIDIYSKLLITSNSDPIFDNDSGMLRRGILEVLTNKFVDKKVYDKLNNKNGYYVVDRTLLNEFQNNVNYKLAFLHILLPYASKYYKINNIFIPEKIEKGFDDLCKENDPMLQFIEEHFEITNNDEDRIHKDEFLYLYNDYYKTKFRWNYLMSDVKRLLTYDRNKRTDGKKGTILGIKLIDDKDDYNFVD